VRVQRHRDDRHVPRPHRDHVGAAQDRAHARGQQIRDEVFCNKNSRVCTASLYLEPILLLLNLQQHRQRGCGLEGFFKIVEW
jgi:hypothetical protein